MIFEYKCSFCEKIFDDNSGKPMINCPTCGAPATRQFHACTNIYIPSYFHTSKSDIFSDTEWQDLKKNPDIERA